MATRIGVDIGGTFTDLVYYDNETGLHGEGKVPTVAEAPEEGVINVIRSHVPAEIIKTAEFFLHGTTVGLNALLERRGAKVGLIATEGFRDVLEIRRGDRAEMYNLFWRQPVPLVPRHLRVGVKERMRFDGTVIAPVDAADVTASLSHFNAHEVDCIAVCLMNGYANPAHELEIERLLRAGGFTGAISLSHRVSGEYREYERTSTTVIDAFVRALMSNYLRRLEGKLRELRFNGACLITRSGSGSMTFAEAEERPFETILSGPVAGAEGAGEFARLHSIPGLITADVGGTSFDTALIYEGRPQLLYEGRVDDMPIQTAWVDVRSIGAGGGSIAYVDEGGLMRVGPRSAGAKPGPAAYGRGGTEPTVTDAATILGMLGPGRLASGVVLDVGKARAALLPVATAIKQELEATAIGIMTIAAASMGNAMREVSLEQGHDPRDMVLLPFGGAGPLMATMLADELQMKRIVLPPLAGNFSAWGMLGADMVQTASRTRIMVLNDEHMAVAQTLLAELFVAINKRGQHLQHQPERRVTLDLRYHGQEHWLSVEVPLEAERITLSAAEISAKFAEEYYRAFGGNLTSAIEIVSIRATLRVALPRRTPQRHVAVVATRPEETHETYSFAAKKRLPFRVIERDALADGVDGPAILTESTATFYLDAGWRAKVGQGGELTLVRTEISL